MSLLSKTPQLPGSATPARVVLTENQRTLINSYPNFDLLGIGPEDFRDGMLKSEFDDLLVESGDGLFAFLMREMGPDCDSRAEAINRIRNAIEDVEAVYAAIKQAEPEAGADLDEQPDGSGGPEPY